MNANFRLTSEVFTSGDEIPARYTCSGESISPPLRWENPPEGTVSMALIVDDPDAPTKTFVHWVLFNIPPEPNILPEGLDPSKRYENSDLVPVEGVNDFGNLGYGAPCPPPGTPHRYSFRLYALDSTISLGTGATKQQLMDAMQGHILAESNVHGVFGR